MIEIFNFLKKSTKFELIYINSEGKQILFDSEIIDIKDDKILITYPKSRTESFDIVNQYERLNVVVYTEDGVLTSNVNVLKKEHGADKNTYISFPYNNQFCQRREDTRIPMHVDFELNISDGDNIVGMYSLKTKNISGKGIACITAEPLIDFNNAEILLKINENEINATCRKVYSKELSLNGQINYINGIAFTEISQNDINYIVKQCLKFQLDSKRNEKLFETL